MSSYNVTRKGRGRPRGSSSYSRTEQIVRDSATLRRSPRISSRYSQEPEPHQLHFTVSSRRTIRERTPILDESSGQSVPSLFDERDADVADNPRHLYGLDIEGDEPESDDLSPISPKEPTKVWNVFSKERVFTSSTPVPSPSADSEPGFFSQIISFFSSLLFKFGSFLYLAATAILCLDVIILHRLFNFTPHSRVGSISRFFILLCILCALLGSLMGGNLISSSKETPVYMPETSHKAFQDLRTSVSAKMDELEKKLKVFETKYKSEMEMIILGQLRTVVDERLSRMESDVRVDIEAERELRKQAILRMQEKINTSVHQYLSEMNSMLEARFAEIHEQLLLKTAEGKLITSDVNDSLNALRETFSEFDQKVENIKIGSAQHAQSLIAKMDEIQDQHRASSNNVSLLFLSVERHHERLSTLEEKHRDVVNELADVKKACLDRVEKTGPLPANVMIQVFSEELEKAMVNTDSPLRQWLNLILASKSDMQAIHKQVEELQSRTLSSGSTDLTKWDVEQMIALALHRYSADRIAKFDFALENSGGCVILDHCSRTYSHSLTYWTFMGVFPLWHSISSPKVIIKPGLYPGDCWAMEGTSGYATLRLKNEVIITGVTLDHIPQELSPNGTLTSAPKDFSVFGLTTLDGEATLLGTFTYEISGSSIQQFPVDKARAGKPFNYVRFQFSSNYGNKDYTCVYRVRVHGHYP